MKVLAHRGLWYNPVERNQLTALKLALTKGFGLETDIRDSGGRIGIAHDPPDVLALPLEKLLTEIRTCDISAPIALNIKADGLCHMLKTLLAIRPTVDYFCFDMSVPETLAYRRASLRYFTRESEHEPNPPLYNDAAGVWMDMFDSDWIEPKHIARHLNIGKQVALVSPELHRRSHVAFWERLHHSGLCANSGMMLCTDYPEAAKDFFNV